MPAVGRLVRLGAVVCALVFCGALTCGSPPALAQGEGERRPYDDDLFRLAELLGAIHYLRELCGANEGQAWRQQMQALLDAEGTTALRRARLTRRFNDGYYSYSRTYNACTPSAKTAIAKFLDEGATLSDKLAKLK